MGRLYKGYSTEIYSKEILLSNVCGSGIRNILVARYSPVRFWFFESASSERFWFSKAL